MTRAGNIRLGAVFLMLSLVPPAYASSEPGKADAQCAAAKSAAGRAAEEDRRAREFEAQAQALTRETTRLERQIRLLQNDERGKASRLAGLQNQLRQSARETENAVQAARSRFGASRSQMMDAGSSRALTYVETVHASLSQFSGSLGRCAERPGSCAAPSLSCPPPPNVSVSPGGGPSSGFVQKVNESNRQFVSEYYQSCQEAGRAAAQTVQEVRAAQSDCENARRRRELEEQKKQRLDLGLRQAKAQAAQAQSEARRFSEESKRASQAADSFMAVRDYCRTPVVDYSARLKALGDAADAAGQKTNDLTHSHGKESR